MRLSWIAPLLFPLLAWCQPAAPPDDLEAVVTTDLGTFRFEFAADKAPKHVEQFLTLARQGYYDGSAFFRVVANGIVQGGDPLLKDPKTARNLWGSGGLNLLPSEISSLKHERGAVSAARIPNKPDSDGAQFFVCLFPQPTLDGQYTVFGHVTEGIEVAERISQAPAAADGMTETPVRILKVTIEKKKVEPFLNATPDEMRKTVTLKTTLGIHQDQDGAGLGAESRAQLSQTGVHGLVQRHRVSSPGERLRGAGRHAQYARERSGASRRPLGAPAQRRVPRRPQTRSRDCLHGPHRRSKFRYHQLLPDARSRAQPGRAILRLRPRGGRNGSI